MKKISQISGKAIPLVMDDVDTDLIIPAQYLTSTTRAGYGENLFRRVREANKNFIFNDANYSGSKILITLNNFGCGSSREHAVWALQQYGIEAIIAVSFADIFFSNSGKNGLLLIQLPLTVVKQLMQFALDHNYSPTINIAEQQIIPPEHDTINFPIDEFRKYCLLHGMDEMDYLLSHKDQIQAYENR